MRPEPLSVLLGLVGFIGVSLALCWLADWARNITHQRRLVRDVTGRYPRRHR